MLRLPYEYMCSDYNGTQSKCSFIVSDDAMIYDLQIVVLKLFGSITTHALKTIFAIKRLMILLHGHSPLCLNVFLSPCPIPSGWYSWVSPTGDGTR